MIRRIVPIPGAVQSEVGHVLKLVRDERGVRHAVGHGLTVGSGGGGHVRAPRGRWCRRRNNQSHRRCTGSSWWPQPRTYPWCQGIVYTSASHCRHHSNYTGSRTARQP
eukprot:763650-Hanusia_phi.AAC.1